MIIWTSKLKQINKMDALKEHLQMRWCLSFKKDQYGFGLNLEREYKNDSRESNWIFQGEYYSIIFDLRDPAWGREHAYYDGCHDSFSLGYLHFCWSLNWCEKCYKSR